MLEIKRIELEGLHNTRDLGGFITEDGRRIKSRRLIRSGELSEITERDKKVLVEDYDLRVIVDFRTLIEINEKPDPDIKGVRYIRNSIFEEKVLGVSREQKRQMDIVEDIKERAKDESFCAVEYMASIYAVIVTEGYSIGRYKSFLEILLDQEEGAVLWHCSAGKDRVGVGTALLLSALGVDRDTIISDYMRTGDFWEDKTQEIVELALERGAPERVEDAIRSLLGVRRSYIDSVFTNIDKKFGGIDDYLKNQMGFDCEKLNKLRKLYLTEA